eukprot:2111857-Pyramimonas_sp.AAC.1
MRMVGALVGPSSGAVLLRTSSLICWWALGPAIAMVVPVQSACLSPSSGPRVITSSARTSLTAAMSRGTGKAGRPLLLNSPV